MSVQLGCNFFHFGPNVNVCFDCANWERRTNQCFTGSPFQKHSFTSPFNPKNYIFIGPKFLHFTLRMPKRFYRKVKSKGFIQQQLHYSNREGFHFELLLVSKKHTMESPKTFKIVTVKKNINLKNVFLFE